MELKVRDGQLYVPWEVQREELYAFLPFRGEASFLFPSVRREENVLVYDIEDLCSLHQWITGDTDPETLCCVLQIMLRNRDYLEEYLIEERNICWDENRIYWNESRNEIEFLYMPQKGEETFADFLGKWSSGLLKRALEENWEEERLLLFLLRLCQAVQKEGDKKKNVELLLGRKWNGSGTDTEQAARVQVITKREKRPKKHFLLLPGR